MARCRNAYTATVIPVGDVIPRRLRPLVTWTTMAGALALSVWAWSQPVFRPAALLWASDAWALGLAGPAVEDRLGRLRFTSVLASGALASLVSALALPAGPWALPVGAATAALAAHAVLFPGSQALAIAPGRPWSVHEIPMQSVALVWAVVRLGTWSLMSTGIAAKLTLSSPLTLVGAALAGGLAAWTLRRRDRESPAWWEGPGDVRSRLPR